MTVETHKHAALRYIAIYKFAKALGLMIVAAVAFGFVHTPWLQDVSDWITQLPIRTGHGLIVRWMDALLDLTPNHFVFIGIGACVYGTLFLVEGIGLWLGKRWAEYLTVFATASLIPIEVYEMWRHPGWLKVLAIVLNVAIVLYLWRIVRRG